MSLLSINRLSHRFSDGTEALRDISFNIDEGEFIILAGKNGSGKTVLMLHLNGLLKPTAGSVEYRGKPIDRNLKTVRQRIGLVFQEPEAQLFGQTVAEDVAFGPENLKLPREEVRKRVDSSMRNLGIEHLADHEPHAISGGEKRKAALAGILAMIPEIIVLDEPFAGLDLPGVRQILKTLIRLHTAGHTILVITHDIEKILAHGSRLIILSEGRIAADGIPGKIVGEAEKQGIRGPRAGMELEDMTWLR